MNEILSSIFIILLQAGILILGAPLARGFIRTLKARLQNRKGPPLFQSYFDLIKLFQKESVASHNSSFIFQIAPWIIFGATASSALFLPVIFRFSPLWFSADIILIVYLLALATFFMALSGLDAGSAFGGMGSSREMMIYSLSEPAAILSIFAVAYGAGSTNIANIVEYFFASPSALFTVGNIFAFLALFIITLAENKRVPVDNPATHLGLTVVHEAMILEYSGRQLALIEWASALKLTIFFVLLANIFFPAGLIGALSLGGILFALVIFALKIGILAATVALVESSIAKLRLFRLPDFIMIAFALAFIALISGFFT